MLTTELERVYTQKMITLCDLENNGISRIEVIGIIQKRPRLILRRYSSTGITVRGKKHPQTAHTTITKRSDVTTNKLLCWNGAVDKTLNELELCNSWHEYWEGTKKSKKIDSFWSN